MSIKVLVLTKEGLFSSGQWPIEVQRAHTEDVLYFLLQEWKPDVVIIDLNEFPSKLISQIRKQSNDLFLGIIACGNHLTQKQESSCFHHGVDYVLPSRHEPWQMDCRIHALVKKSELWQQSRITLKGEDDKLLSFHKICLDSRNHLVTVSGKVVNVTPTQFRLLRVFMSYPNHLLTRSWIRENVWGHLNISARSIDAHISKLKKLFPVLETHLISIYGKGYRLSHEREKAA